MYAHISWSSSSLEPNAVWERIEEKTRSLQDNGLISNLTRLMTNSALMNVSATITVTSLINSLSGVDAKFLITRSAKSVKIQHNMMESSQIITKIKDWK